MKIVDIELTRSERIRVPICVPDHWATTDIRQALRRSGCACLYEITDEICDRGWEWISDGEVSENAIYIQPDYSDEEPVFTFPDEANPDQLSLIA